LAEAKTDLFIVGGGPAGLAAAISASKLGLKVAVADGAVPPINKPCGEGLMPDGVAALESLGVRLKSGDAYPFRGSRFVDRKLQAVAHFKSAHGIGIRRTVLHQRMIECSERCGVRLLWNSPVRQLTGTGVGLKQGFYRARWIIGADGTHSRVRRWAALDVAAETRRRFCVRQHFQIAPWASEVILHWGRSSQLFVTPVAEDQIGVVAISSTPLHGLQDCMYDFPELAARLHGAKFSNTPRGKVTTMRRLPRVYRGRVALIGDASGSVDAITGQGLCLAFLQAGALASAILVDDLAQYQVEHRRIMRKPRLMAQVLLHLARYPFIRRRTLRAFSVEPELFSCLLGLHVGDVAARQMASVGVHFGWRFLTA
jgi:menaquinone-9 beta-reductase